LTNVLLQVRPFMMVMEVVTICGLTFAIAALALGFGALYPQFETENAAQIPTSFGGLSSCMATIALLGAVIFVLWQAVVPVRPIRLPGAAGGGRRLDDRVVRRSRRAVRGGYGAAALIGLRRIERFEF